MRFFSPGVRQLAKFALPMKISLTFFVVFMLLGLATSLALYHQQFAFDPDQALKYYLGNADDVDAEVFFVEKSYRQLLEVTHFHIYIMPIVYLGFIHLYFLTTRSEREKIVMSFLVFGSALLEIALPWIVRYWIPGASALFFVSGSILSVTTIWMSLVCLVEMWTPESRQV